MSNNYSGKLNIDVSGFNKALKEVIENVMKIITFSIKQFNSIVVPKN